jgi:hypothetical protein
MYLTFKITSRLLDWYGSNTDRRKATKLAREWLKATWPRGQWRNVHPEEWNDYFDDFMKSIAD